MPSSQICTAFFQAAQCVLVQFRRGEALVAGEAAAVDAFRNDHSFAQRRAISISACASPRCWVLHVTHGDRLVLRDEVQLVEQMRADEAHRVVHVEALIGQALTRRRVQGLVSQ